jgi:hypothetical protein
LALVLLNYKPELILIDGGYGNNSDFLNQLEEKNLIYIGGIAKNRKVKQIKEGKILEEKRIDEIANLLGENDYKMVRLGEKKLWVALVKVEIEKLSGEKTIAIVTGRINSGNKLFQRQPLMNAESFAEDVITDSKATEIDYLITNENRRKITAEWIVNKYSRLTFALKIFTIDTTHTALGILIAIGVILPFGAIRLFVAGLLLQSGIESDSNFLLDLLPTSDRC